MSVILQEAIPYDVSGALKLPGVQPLRDASWLWVDEAYAAQLARKADLVAQRRADVIALNRGAAKAAQELLDLVVEESVTRHGFVLEGDVVVGPDGRRVCLDYRDPLGYVSQLVQEDFAILQKHGEEHVLTGALLCFPASWTLAEKFMQPLGRIHHPVAEYDEGVTKRVQRLFDGVRVGQPLWRYNALRYVDPELYQPRSEYDPRAQDSQEAKYLRSERQVILRLPKSGAVVFAIHTFVIEI